MTRAAVIGVAAAALALAGCRDKEPAYAGIGPWRFTRSQLSDVTAGRCQPTDLQDGRRATWCFGNQPYAIAGRAAEVDLYFLGTEPTSKLIEIQLQIRGCLETETERWISTNFGPPIERRPGRAYWKNDFLWIAALTPSSPGRCLIHMLPLSEAAEIARLKQK